MPRTRQIPHMLAEQNPLALHIMGGKGSKAAKASQKNSGNTPPVVVYPAEPPVKTRALQVGDAVKSAWGTGVVDSIRTDGTVCYVLDNWTLGE